MNFSSSLDAARFIALMKLPSLMISRAALAMEPYVAREKGTQLP